MKEKLIETVAKAMGLKPQEISLHSHFYDHLHCDSLDLVEITLDVEQEFEVELDDEDLENMKTVEDLLKLVEKAKEPV